MNKTNLISIAIFFAVGLIMGLMFRGCNRIGNEQTKTVTVIKFVPRTDTMYMPSITYVPKPFAVERVVRGHDTIYVPTNAGLDMAGYVIDAPQVNDCDSLRSYSDSIRKDNEFKAVVNSLVRGKLEKQTVQWANLAPIEVKTVTNTVMKKPPLVKVYLGIDASFNRTHADLAPALSAVISDRYMIDAGYYIFTSQVTVGAKIKLTFRKP